MSASDVLRVSDHLVGCAICREAFARARSYPPGRPGDFLASLEDTMPTFDGSRAPTMADSTMADELLADLAGFRDELARLPVKFHGPHRPVGAPPSRTRGGKLVSPPEWRWRMMPAWAAGLAALFVALAVVWGLFARSNQNNTTLLRDARGQAVNLAGLPDDLRTSVETALHTGQLPPSPVSDLSTTRGVLAGTTSEPVMSMAFPVEVIVREDRPTFRWTSHPEATGYKVSVVPADGGAVLSSPVLPATQTRWTPLEVLKRGETYAWQVAVSRDGKVIDRVPKPPAGEARFVVLDAGRDAALVRVEERAAGNALVLGVAYWRAGLTGAAADQFDHLADMHSQSAVARDLSRAAHVNASRTDTDKPSR